MSTQRRHYAAEEKVSILRRHLVEKVPVSELCEQLGLQPTVFYRWQKTLFDNGAAAGNSSCARCTTSSTSASLIASRISQ